VEYMNKGKIIIDGVETEFYFGIEDDAIERNEEAISDTLDLRNVVEEVNERKENQ